MSDLRIGVVGLGYWGPNLARNFDTLARLRARLAVRRPAPRSWSAWAPRTRRPAARRTSPSCLDDPDLDAVVLATPVPAHADLAVAVLQAGKHCFVEKPLAQSVADAERAVEAAADVAAGC